MSNEENNKTEEVKADEPTETTSEMVTRQAYERVLNQHKRTKQELATLQAEVDDVYKMKDELEAERESFNTKHAELTKRIKADAFLKEVGKVHPKYLEFADLDSIELDDNLQINPDALREATEKFRVEHYRLIEGRIPTTSEATIPPFTTQESLQPSIKDLVAQRFGKK